MSPRVDVRPPSRGNPGGARVAPVKRDSDIDLRRIVLDVVAGGVESIDVTDMVLDARIRDSMTFAPTFSLTVHDPEYALMNSKRLWRVDKNGDRQIRAIDLELEPGRWYRLVKVSFNTAASGSGVDLKLEFEHRIIAWLRVHNKPLKVSRNAMTRAEFILKMVREIKREKIIFFCPELHKKQPIAKASDEEKRRRAKREKDLREAASTRDELGDLGDGYNSGGDADEPLTGGGPYGNGTLRPSSRVSSFDPSHSVMESYSAGGPYGNGTLSPSGESSLGGPFGNGTLQPTPTNILTVKTRRATAQQRAILGLGVSIGEDLGATPRAIISCLAALVTESGASNLAGGDGGKSSGPLQLTHDTARRLRMNPRNVRSVIKRYYTGGYYTGGGAMHNARRNPNKSIHMIAQETQGSAFSDGRNYAEWVPEAKKNFEILSGTRGESYDDETLGGIGGDGASGGRFYYEQFNYTRGIDGKRENSYQAADRLAKAVNWRFFVMGRKTVVYASEPTLFKARARMWLSPNHPAVFSMSGDSDVNKDVKTMRISARMDRWAAPPGSVVVVEDLGVYNGRWLVDEVERSLFSPLAEIVLKKPEKPDPEERPQMREASANEPDAGDEDIADIALGSAEVTSGMTAYNFINRIVLPIAARNGVRVSVAQNDAANARHSQYVAGTNRVSEHKGPKEQRWAADLPCYGRTGDRLCKALAEEFGIQGSGAGSYATHTYKGFGIQLLWKVSGHYNHVHVGAHRL